MLSIYESSRGTSRREWLRVGGLNALGLSLPAMLSGESRAAVSPPDDAMFGRAKNVIFLWMS